ncbi:Low-affinity potassium transport protein [Talaromyces pinophilus]|nr:Low-affinity potassium transport protein [Talaromyces pinophilus]
MLFSGAMHTFLNPMLLDTLSKPPSVNVFENITAGEDLFQLSALPTTSAKIAMPAQTMVDNLGFTLTPDSMVHFNDATWPLLVMSFLAFAGNTLCPVVLRLFIWTFSKIVPKDLLTKETLQFILDHPRRCYTLLFPSQLTWILFDIIFLLNFVDVLLVILLDLHNPAVNSLSLGPRILAAIFQAASARHTGTSSFNLANVNPAVQFSLVIMMYIAILPIAISIRSSNTYEEALGVYSHEEGLGESNGSSYVMTHIRNQPTFDLWYIFLGTFCICIAESQRIMDDNDPVTRSRADFSLKRAVAVFPVFFEVVSGYGNVGHSLGYPTVNTSPSGQFTTFNKVVMCFMMIRGRYRGLPYALDRAIMLPSDHITKIGPQSDDAACCR